MPKFNDVREDGFVFRGWERRNGRVYEKWMSPAAAKNRAEKMRAWVANKRKTDPEFLERERSFSRESMRRMREERPQLRMLSSARARAKQKGIEFSITEDDVHIPDTCPALGIKLKRGAGVSIDSSPELDRIDNSKGYVPGNVIVISRRANRIKNDATVSELRRIADFIEKIAPLRSLFKRGQSRGQGRKRGS